MHEQPVVGDERFQPLTGIDIGRALGDVDVHADAEIGRQPGSGLQRLVLARERGMDPNHAATAGAQEALVLGKPRRAPSAPWRSVTP